MFPAMTPREVYENANQIRLAFLALNDQFKTVP